MLTVRFRPCPLSIVILPIASRILKPNIEMPLYYYTSGITLAFGHGIFDMNIEQSQSQSHIYRPVAEWPMWKRSVFSINDIWKLKSDCTVFDSDVHKVHLTFTATLIWRTLQPDFNFRGYCSMEMQPFFYIGHCAAAFDMTSNNLRVHVPSAHRMYMASALTCTCGTVDAGRRIGAFATKGIYWMLCVYDSRSIAITTIRCLIQVDGASSHYCKTYLYRNYDH